MTSFEALADALREIQDLETLLRPRVRGGEGLVDAVRRLIAEVEKPRLVPPVVAGPLGVLKTPRQIVASCPGLTTGSLKWMLFNSRTNGMEEHLVRIGRKVLIDEAGFLAWLKSRKRAA